MLRAIADLICFSTLLFFLFALLLLPLGHLLVRLWWKNLGVELQILAAFALSTLSYASLLVPLVYFQAPSTVLSIVLWLIVAASFFRWISLGCHRVLVVPQIAYGFAVFFLYSLLCVTFAAYPSGKIDNVSAAGIMSFTGLPIDNLISYNSSRYLIERIDPDSIEVVPNWRFTERGPLAGFLNAVVFSLLDLKETGSWLSPSPGLFFVYEALLVFLNALSLLAVWLLSCLYCGRATAVAAVLLLVSTHFLAVNVFFSWPKLYAAFFVLVAIAVWQRERRGALTGMLLAGALLTHESTIFCLIAFAVWSLAAAWLETRRAEILCAPGEERYRSFGALFPILAAFSGLMAPWALYKLFCAASSPRLLYLHLFCNKDQDADSLSFARAAARYFSQSSLVEILSVRLNNLLYPVNVFHPLDAVLAQWPHIYRMAASVAPLAFYQLVFALGAPAFLLFAAAWFRLKSDAALRQMIIFLAICGGALVPAALSFACPLSSWNHIWAYPAFLFCSIPAARVAVTSSLWAQIVFAFGVSTNFLIMVLNAYFSPPSSMILHASTPLLAACGIIYALLIVVLFGGAWLPYHFGASRSGVLT